MQPDLDEAKQLLARTPRVLRAFLSGIPRAWLECHEGADTFTPIDVVGHLIHGERTDWLPRVRRILADGEEVPFDPFDRHGHREMVARLTLDELLDEFERARGRSLFDLESLALRPEDLARRGRHPAFGAVTLGQLIATWVVHDLGHIRQICRVMAARYSTAVGPWRAYLPVLEEGPSARS